MSIEKIDYPYEKEEHCFLKQVQIVTPEMIRLLIKKINEIIEAQNDR